MIPFTKTRYYLSDKGLQEKSSALLISPRELQIANNVHFYETGSWTTRNGYQKRFTNDITGTPIITGEYELIQRNGTKTFLITADKLYKGAQGDASPVEISGGLTFTPGSNGENFMSFITFNNKALGVNGIEAMWQYNGTTGAIVAGSPPLNSMIIAFQGFVFAAGNTTFPYRLYFSNDGVETTWTATDYIDIGDLTQAITGFAVLFGKLVIFTRKGMFELRGYDRDTFIIDEISFSTGCIAYKSIVKVDNNLVFLSDRGFYSFDGINVHYLSQGIVTTIADLNYNRINKTIAELYKAKNQIWFSVSTGSNTRHNAVICMTYDPTASEDAGIKEANVAFANYTGMAINAFGLETSSTELDRLYTGNYAGRVYQQDKGTDDDGAGIAFKVKSPPIDAGEPEEFKRFRYIWLFIKQAGSYSVSIDYKTDFGVGGSSATVTLSVAGNQSLWGTMVWGTGTWGGNTIIKSRVGLKAKGHFIEITFSNSNVGQPISIKGFSLISQLKNIGRK